MDTLLTYLLLGLSCCARIQAANTTVNATSPTGNDTYSARLHCAESWSAYSASSSADVTYITSTVTSYDTTDAHLTYGTNKVYTTSNGIPVASGRFTRTSVVRTVLTITTTFEDIEGTTLHPSEVSATPTCSPPSPSECSMLYVSYLNSLGLPANASVPSVTPAPTNSPACPEYYYKPFSTCTTFLDTGADLGICSVIGANAKLFYFPTKTAGAAATATGDRGTITPTVVHSYAPGVTFTSPSVYLSFDTLSALSIVAGREYACTSCGWNGCQASAVGGGDALELIGTSTTGALLALAPTDVSSLLVSYPAAQATSVANVIAHGLEGFANDASDVLYAAGDFLPKALDLNALAHPAPTDYYLRPNGAPGCDNPYPAPECSTIFEGLYRPILSLPSQVSLLQSAWSTCIPARYGVSAAPVALTRASTSGGTGIASYQSSITADGAQSTDTCRPEPATAPTAVIATVTASY